MVWACYPQKSCPGSVSFSVIPDIIYRESILYFRMDSHLLHAGMTDSKSRMEAPVPSEMQIFTRSFNLGSSDFSAGHTHSRDPFLK